MLLQRQETTNINLLIFHLKIKVMLSVNILEIYANKFENLVRMPKRANKAMAFAKNVTTAGKNEELSADNRAPQINYFAGPHCVFFPRMK